MAFPWIAAAMLASSAVTSYADVKGQKSANVASAEQAQLNRDFQERMSRHAHRYEVEDLKEAGLNPILSAKYGGASTPTGAMPDIKNEFANLGDLRIAQTLQELDLKEALIKKAEGEAESSTAKGYFDELKRSVADKILNAPSRGLKGLNSAVDTFKDKAMKKPWLIRLENWFRGKLGKEKYTPKK